jgi:hypothetical protein
MPKASKGPKGKPPTAPKSTKLPRKLPDDPIARGVAIMREATGEKSAKKR